MNPLNTNLGILLWKHMKERSRRIFHSTWEIVSGLLMFVILLLLKQILIEDKKHLGDFVQDVHLVDLAFSPQNELTQKLMMDICSENSNKQSSALPGTVLRCFAFANETYVAQFLNNNSNFSGSDAVISINFENLKGKQIPKDFIYSMNIAGHHFHKVTKLKDLYYMYHDIITTIEKNQTFFASLQWEIDKSYMKMLLGDMDHKLEFRTFSSQSTSEMRVIHSFLVVCTVLAPLPFFLSTHSALVDEKRSGITALLKLSGVRPGVVRLAHLIDTTIFAALYSIIVVALLHTSAILEKSNPFIIFLTFILHFFTITSLAFITSTASQNDQHSDAIAVLVYLLMLLVNMLWVGRHFMKSAFITMLYLLLPHAPVFMFWNDVFAFEKAGEGANFKNIYKSFEGRSSVLAVWLIFVFQLAAILTISWYLDLVKPGAYGVALEPHFIFSVHYEGKFKKTKSTTSIDHINLDIINGIITVILGTNGSGKTTLMSIVSGMSSATSGHVYVNGLDIKTRLRDLRSDLSYLPQQDLTFEYLTVRENLTFFQYVRLKKDDVSDVDRMLELFALTNKADNYSKELSTGYRRCLQIACALISNAEILVFDEPSLGMDASMKHRLWDLLLTLRHSKTIFMATSCMEEADALGDRIALLHHGKIKCYASPSFLKAAIGADFKLSLRFSDKHDLNNIQEVIETNIQDAKIPVLDESWVTTQEMDRLSVYLPTEHRDRFPKMFQILEAHYKELGILSVDVGVSLEQVFLRFVDEEDILDISIPPQDYPEETRLQGFQLRWQQLHWLVHRVWKHVLLHKYLFIIVQVIVPLLALITITIACNSSSKYVEALDQAEVAKVLYSYVGRYRRVDDLESVVHRYPQVKFAYAGNVVKEIKDIHIQRDNSLHHTHHAIGIVSTGKLTKIFYPVSAAPVLPTAVNIFSNMLMSMYVPKSVGRSIHTTILPMRENKRFTPPKNLFLCYVWCMWITFLVIIPLGPLVRLCIEEYFNGVRFNHLLMGCPPYIIWLSKLLAHIVVYLAIVPCSVMIVAKLLDKDRTIDRWEFLGALFVLLIVFAPAHLLHWYVLSFTLNGKRPVAKMYIVSLGFGLITPIFVYFLSEISDKWPVPLLIFLHSLYFLANFVPAFTFSVGMGKIGKVARNNAFCSLNHHLCPTDMIEDVWVSKEVCCESNGKPYAYYSNYYTGLLELTFLIVQSILYWIILLLLQRRALQPIWSKIIKSPYTYKRPEVKQNKCLRVKAEEIYVHDKIKGYHCIKLEERQRDVEAVLVADLYKSYSKCCRQTVHAVKDVSFAVRKGESLAVLGQNGAGKTTTLSMVSGYTVMTSGVICVNGHFWNEHKGEYFHNIAWCTGKGFDPFLTGLQNIQYLAALHGYPSYDTLYIAKRYLQYMGLSRYSNTQFSSYSPGCAHRLAMCTALISSPHAVLLDELCANVDPYTRPLLTRAIQLLMSKQIACIIAEQSLEWKQIDEFCTRLAILDRGELVAIGTVGEIRRSLASGYSAIIKLKVDKCYKTDEENQNTAPIFGQQNLIPSFYIEDLKTEFAKLFTSSILVDEHMSMLYFHIKDPNKELTYSSMFQNLEQLAGTFDIIEDYILRETSIDEILCRVSQAHELHGDPNIISFD